MNILSADGISINYSERLLLDRISIGINEGDKIGLIGVNGTGKSTLLKLLAGIEQPDEGKITKSSGIRIEYLPQNPSFEVGGTVLREVFRGTSPVVSLVREYEYTLQQLNEKPGDSRQEKRLLALTQSMESMGAWTFETEAKNVLTRLGILDFNIETGVLSGGQKKRVALAGALINESDLLLLDEPTNHIDNNTVDWLEQYLNKRKGALLMVTHDRYFLDRVVNRIIELDNGRLYVYQANYSKYLEMKAEREELEQTSEKKRQNLLRNELEWIRRGAKARSTKQKARIDRFERLQDERGSAASSSIEIKAGSSRLGKKIIHLEHISKSFPGIDAIKDFSYILLRDDRIGIIGANGIGKTTLLRIISGRLCADSGRLETGETVKIGLFSQENEDMDESLRVIDFIRNEAEYITTGEGSISASQMLERFLFPPSVQWTPISRLSGGEKRRLYLLRILMGAPNVLLLDEPTNDLDIQTLTILESYLDDFQGAVVAVSHDRYFLDRVVDRVFFFEGNGVIKQYEGNYSDYQDCVRQMEAEKIDAVQKPLTDKDGGNVQNKKDRPLKFTFKEQKEYELIDDIITGLEKDLKNVDIMIDEAASDFQRLQELLSKKEFLKGQLEEAVERWVYLNELADEISKNRKATDGGYDG